MTLFQCFFSFVFSASSGSSSAMGSAAISSNSTDSQTVSSNDKFSENDVKELSNLGFTREQVIFELRRFNGDKTQAIAALFAKSLKF